MSARGKILLLSFFGACALATVGVYAWHEIVLVQMSDEELPYTGPLLAVIEGYLKAEPPDRIGAEGRLMGMPEWDRDRIVAALSERPEKDRRMLAVLVARRLRDRPIPRAVLARLVLEDSDPKVKEAAKRALNGDPP